MSIQAVSFGKQALTKKGAPYEKTNLGGKIGAAVGAGYATYAGVKEVKGLRSLNALKFKEMYEMYKSVMPTECLEFVPKFKDYALSTLNTIKKIAPFTIGIFAGLSILAGFGIGKIADAIVNKVRRNKADAQNV